MAGARYKELVDEEEAARLARVVGALEAKDAAQQRMAAITKLPVGAWRCAVCQTTSERRRPQCQVGCRRQRYAVACTHGAQAPICALRNTSHAIELSDLVISAMPASPWI